MSIDHVVPAAGDAELVNADPAPAVPHRAWWREMVPGACLALVIGALAAVMLGSRRPGHWWGDDWALYIRQAEGLLHFDPGEVARANEYTVTHSRGAAFSPALYPWGFPLLLALAIPFTGSGVDGLANVEVLAACAFAALLLAIAQSGGIESLVTKVIKVALSVSL